MTRASRQSLPLLLRRVRHDRRGISMVEFALISPALFVLTMGAFDAAYSLYMITTVQGIVQKVSRDASLESNVAQNTQYALLDAKVQAQVKAVANNAQITFARRFYRTFSSAAAHSPEKWTDTNKNGTCDAGEPYVDANNNGNWDSDGGDAAANSGAKDKMVYTVTVTMPRMFPIYNWIGGSKTLTVTGQSVLANQPFTDQNSYLTAPTRNCP